MRISWSTVLALSLTMTFVQENAGAQSLPESSYEAQRHAAIQINDLAGRIRTEADAAAYVSAMADLFAKELPPAWTQHDVLQRIAHAEFDSVGKPPKLIPEQRIADIWNQYVREIGAPDEVLVSAAEIHNMRDGTLTIAQRMWSQGRETIWTMPNTFAVGSEGKVADGCRALEALRIMHDLDDLFQNLSSARERLRKGIVLSEQLQPRSAITGSVVIAHAGTNAVRVAERRYLQNHGPLVFQQLLIRLFDELFPPE